MTLKIILRLCPASGIGRFSFKETHGEKTLVQRHLSFAPALGADKYGRGYQADLIFVTNITNIICAEKLPSGAFHV